MEPYEKREWVNIESEGLKLFGVMHTPLHPKDVNYPGILICHGFGGNKCGRHRMYVSLSQHLSKAGIASLRIDFRGCGDSEGDFHDTTLHGEVNDALAALDFFVKHSHTDPNRIGILGRSLGGPIAVMTAAQYGNMKAIGLWSAVFSAKQWRDVWEQEKAASVEKLDDELIRFNNKATNLQFIQEFFMMNLEPDLEKLSSIPMLNFHGNLDDMVIADNHSTEYARVRENASADSFFKRYPNCDHDFTDPEEQLDAIQKTCDWFGKVL